MSERYYLYSNTFVTVLRDRTVELDDYNTGFSEDMPGVVKLWRHKWGVCKDDSGKSCCGGHTELGIQDLEEAEKLCAELNVSEE